MNCTRRELLKAGLIGLLALPLAGCGGPSGPVSKAPPETLRVSIPALQPSLDPHAWSDATGPRTLDPLFDALTFIQSDGKLRPALALAWSQRSATVWQFRLRVDDAKFHTGEMFTPDSVRFTFERLRGAKLPLSRLAAGVERVDVVDPATINVVTSEPDPSLPRWISAVYLLPPAYFGKVGEAGFASQPVGTGFWMLDDFQPGSHLHLNVYRDTWRGDRGATAPPPLKRLELEVAPQPADRLAALRALDVDVATEIAPDATLKAAGFLAQTADLGQLNAPDAAWQTDAFGAPLSAGSAALATAADLKGVTQLPNGSWWFDRVTKTALQRVAVAGGA
jgi:peptide/nickel transport system substrate-binding protein